MAIEMFYERINWENYPSVSTPVNEINLNKVDYALKTLNEQTVQLNTTKAEQATVLNTVQDWSLDESTGIITITKVNGDQINFDLNVEKIPVSFSLSEEGILTMTTDDGTVFTADIGSMIPIIELEGSETVSVTKERVITELATNIKNFTYTFEEPFTGKICIRASSTQSYNANIITEDGEMGGLCFGSYFPYVKNALSFSVESTLDLERIYLDYTQIQKYIFEIPDGAITEQKLNPNYLAEIKLQAETATQSATSASASATQASASATRAYDEAERAKLYADTVQEGITTTTSRTLTESHAGGLKINSMDGESQQNGTPTPDTPIDINSVVVSEIKGVGKNLDNAEYVNAYIEMTAKHLYPSEHARTSIIKCMPNTTYTATRNTLLDSFRMAWYSEFPTVGNQNIKYKGFINNDNETTLSITTGIDAQYLAVTWCNLSRTENVFEWSQIEEGSISTPFEEYQESTVTLSAPITLRGIGDVKDVLCKRDGVFGVLRGVKEIDLSTITSWTKGYGFTNTYCLYNSSILSDAVRISGYNQKANILCNRLSVDTASNITTNEVNAVGQGEKTLYVSFVGISTSADLISYLSNNNTYVYYKLETPTFEPLPIADQILLYQLETFDTVTYISTDSTIEPIMEVEYGTSKVGAYTIKGMNTADANVLKIEQLNTLTNELATQLVAGSEV